MTTATTPKTVPTRADIDPKHAWDLTHIYANENDWERDYARCKTLSEKAPSYIGKLGSSAAVLYECLEIRSEVNLLTGRLYQYAYLNKDLDTRVSKYQELTERAAMLASDAGAAFAFIEPELLEMDAAKLQTMANQFPDTTRYDMYIRDLIRSKAHIRSSEVEELLAQSTIIARGPDAVFSMLNDADLKYPSIKDENGNEVALSKQRFARFMDSPDRRVRKDAFVGFYSVYKEHVNTFAASLAASINKDIFYAKARRFDSCLHSALHGNDIPLSVYHSLIESTEKKLDSFHDFIKLRKQILKIDTIEAWDMACPLFPEQNYDVPYNEAVENIRHALRPLGARYCTALESAFDHRWVDVYETQGKGSGAYSYSTYGKHAFILMNYNETVDDMFTLAHELGHALHSHLANETQPYPKAGYSIFVAEVASTLNEGLLQHYLLSKVKDTRQRLFLINRQIDNTMGTYFYQVLLAHFELLIHEEVEKGAALSPERLSDIYHDLLKKYYGPHYSIEELGTLKWSRIGHFYNPFYVYQYATSYAASQAILDKILSGETGIVEKYLGMLAGGGCDYPIELLKRCGIDMTTSAPVDATLKLFAEQVEEMGRLA